MARNFLTECVYKAKTALKAHAGATGRCAKAGHKVTDLICDLGHYSTRHGYPFLDVVQEAIGLWAVEKDDPYCSDMAHVTITITPPLPMTTTQTERIRELNDRLRTTTEPIGALMMNGSLVITATIAERGNAFIDQCLSAVRRFDDFTEDNDPHGEHDMAFLDVAGERIFFKVDYYDVKLKWHSPDPADPGVTRRVLTIGLAEDY